MKLLLTLLLGAALVFPGELHGATPAHVRGKVTRYWDRQLHTDLDPGPQARFLLEYEIQRCGPRACIVYWHDRDFGDEQDTYVEREGVSACYAPKVRVHCYQRSIRQLP